MSIQLYCEEFSGNMLALLHDRTVMRLENWELFVNKQILRDSVFIEIYGNVLVRKAKC